MDKLGIKEGLRVSVLGIDDRQFMRELKMRTSNIVNGSAAANSDIVFLAADSDDDRGQLGAIAGSINQNGAIWVVWPKGRAEFKESNVRRAALARHLVDVKVASFSDTLSALKLVIPRAKRV
jgi:hypothetical protein